MTVPVFRMNLYRGCAHGCVYCDSRSRCYQFTHPFEDIEVKRNAPELLETILRGKRKRIMIGTGSMSDPYQPCEETLRLTRCCLALIDRYGFGATVITKSDRVLRDIDLFESINRKAKSVLQMSLTIADDGLSRILEPNVCPSSRRYEVLKEFQQHGIPTVVWMTTLLPFLTDTDENFEQLMDWCLDAGVRGIICFNIGMTLRDGNREYYYRALDSHFPGLSDRYRMTYGNAYEVVSENSHRMMARFHAICEAHGILHDPENAEGQAGHTSRSNSRTSSSAPPSKSSPPLNTLFAAHGDRSRFQSATGMTARENGLAVRFRVSSKTFAPFSSPVSKKMIGALSSSD